MKFEKGIMQALRDGKKVKRSVWNGMGVNKENLLYDNILFCDYLADDWEIVEEEPFLTDACPNCHNDFFITAGYDGCLCPKCREEEKYNGMEQVCCKCTKHFKAYPGRVICPDCLTKPPKKQITLNTFYIQRKNGSMYTEHNMGEFGIVAVEHPDDKVIYRETKEIEVDNNDN